MQAIIRQKDYELEQRASLLYKTKAAIEELQQQVFQSRSAERNLQDEADKVSLADTKRKVFMALMKLYGSDKKSHYDPVMSFQ